MSLIIDPSDNQNEVQDQDRQQNEHLAHLAQVETHLQVSNLVKILFTVNYDVLSHLVSSSPEDLQKTPHYRVLAATLEYYTNLIKATQPPQE
jgi:hypothetical protein